MTTPRTPRSWWGSEIKEPLRFRCGACGTSAAGFAHASDLRNFAADHAKVCPGYPPSSREAA